MAEWGQAVVDTQHQSGVLEVPDTIQDVILARIDRLPDAAKRLLQTAAVLGSRGAVRVLQACWEGPEACAPLLDVLQQQTLLTVYPAPAASLEASHKCLRPYPHAGSSVHEPGARPPAGTAYPGRKALEICSAHQLATVCEPLAAHYTQALALLDSGPAVDQDAQRLELVLRLAQAWSFL